MGATGGICVSHFLHVFDSKFSDPLTRIIYRSLFILKHSIISSSNMLVLCISHYLQVEVVCNSTLWTMWVCGRCFGCDEEAVEGRNMCNDFAYNRSQKRCFIPFYYVLFHLHTFTFVMLNGLIVLFYCGIRVGKIRQIFILCIDYYE